MNNARRVLLVSYSFIIALIGILFVPCYAMWGNAVDKEIHLNFGEETPTSRFANLSGGGIAFLFVLKTSKYF